MAPLAVAAPTVSNVTNPAITAKSLCRGQGTPATSTFDWFAISWDGLVTKLSLPGTRVFGYPKIPMWASSYGLGEDLIGGR